MQQDGASMEILLLGPLEVVGDDGPVPIAAQKERRLLAALALVRGRPSSTDELVEAVWGEASPRSARKLLQVYVSKLRKVLPKGAEISTTPGGYALEIDAEAFDVARFERLLAEGRAALRDANATLAASLLDRAISLW